MLEDFIRATGYVVAAIALISTGLLALPCMVEQATSDSCSWSGATPEECDYSPFNTLPPTFDNE